MARKTFLRPVLASSAVSAVLAVAGCGTVSEALDTRQNAGPCPASLTLYDASRYVKFAPGATEERFNNIAWSAEITDVRLFCRYAGDNPIVADIEIDFAFGRGAQADGLTHDYPFFVSVTRRNRAVLEKDFFTVTAEFDRGARVTGKTVSFERLEIPRYDETISGANFEVIVGFDLAEEQLAFNRAGKRFRLDAASTLD